jgi:hypothetical protein
MRLRLLILLFCSLFVADAAVMLSGSDAPSSGAGSNGDLYHRTDTRAIYGPKSAGAWPATFSYVVGKGCTTAYHIDKDCDGYGVGPTSQTTDPNPLFDVDADDNDATVNTSASVLTKYGTINAFLAYLGYPTNVVKYIDPVGGNDSTGDGSAGNPYLTWQPLATTFNHNGAGTGGTVLWRAGAASWGSVSNPFATSFSAPVVVMAYPGERVTIQGINLNTETYGKSANVIYDGWTLRCPVLGAGNGFDANHVNGITLKNMEMSGCSHAWQVGGGGQDLTIDNTVMHDTSSHAVYPTSAGLYAAGQFDCAAWTWDTTGGNFPNGFNPYTNLRITNSLVYNSGTGGLEALHLNAYICGGAVSGNIIHNTGGTGIGLQTSVQGTSSVPFLVANNLIVSNQSAGITISVYGCDNNGSPAAASQFDPGGTCFGSSFGIGTTYYPGMHDYISIVNNTIWTGQYATQGGGDCSPTDPGYSGGQCTIPSYGIYVTDYSVGTPGNRWIKHLTIQNNTIGTYNDCGAGRRQLQFTRNSFPDTYTIKNNVFHNLAGSDQCAVMHVSSDAQSASPGTFTFTQFQSYNTGSNGGNVFGSPLFTDSALGYYATPHLFNMRLSASSPAIGTGLHAGAPSFDVAGMPRANPPSIGAYDLPLAWSQHSPGAGPPGFAGWGLMFWDPYAQKIGSYGQRNSTQGNSIYSTDFSYADLSGAAPVWTLQSGGTGSADNAASAATSNTSAHPKDRHPYGQLNAVDTYRGLTMLAGGSNGGGFNDTGFESLHSNIALNQWYWVTPANYPSSTQFNASAYDADNDLIVNVGKNIGGFTKTHLYCNSMPVGGGTPSGTPTAAQTASGRCSTLDNWVDVTPGTSPPTGYAGLENPYLAYDTATAKTLLYGGVSNTGVVLNQLWAYDSTANTWTRKCLSCTMPPAQTYYTSYPSAAYDSVRHGLWIHVPNATPETYFYDAAADTMTLVQSGGGPSVTASWQANLMLAHDPVHDKLLTYNLAAVGTGGVDVWVATLGTAPAAPSGGGSQFRGTLRGVFR